ncbi:MAG: hypothetical protein K2G45_12790 [Lachnospiraceae bacterium]|nr:hypothetical protein [Lachnospiraceae bacterium]
MTILQLVYIFTIIIDLIWLVFVMCLKPLNAIKCKMDKTKNYDADDCINQNGCEPSLSDEELYDVKKRTSNHVALLGGVLSAFGIIELVVWINAVLPLNEPIILKALYIVLVLLWIFTWAIILVKKGKVFDNKENFLKRTGYILKRKRILLPNSSPGLSSEAYFIKVRVKDFKGNNVSFKLQVGYDLFTYPNNLCYVVFYNNQVLSVIPYSRPYGR